MPKTILELDNSEAALSGPSSIYVATQKTGEDTAKKTTLLKINALFGVDSTSTASGEYSATLNANSGILSFTGEIPANDFVGFEINNSLITTTSLIGDVGIIFDQSIAVGKLVFGSYKRANGLLTLFVHNMGSDVSEPFQITFRILNPA